MAANAFFLKSFILNCSLLSLTTTYCFFNVHQRKKGDPLRVYLDLEPGRRRSAVEDIFISYHASDDIQATYAGGLFHNNRNYKLSSTKNDVRSNIPCSISLFNHTHISSRFMLLIIKLSETAKCFEYELRHEYEVKGLLLY